MLRIVPSTWEKDSKATSKSDNFSKALKTKLILKLNIFSGGRSQIVHYNFITNMGVPMKSKSPDSHHVAKSLSGKQTFQ